MQVLEKTFGHKLIGSSRMVKMVKRTLTFFSEDISDFVIKNCWIVGSFEDGWAFTLRGDELKRNEYLIFLSDELLAQDEDQIIWTIAHEIGHVILGHRNSIGKVQTKTEVAKQERDADAFAKKYIF